jgi:pimeloyl-ACP methyl ester carboxylesterase
VVGIDLRGCGCNKGTTEEVTSMEQLLDDLERVVKREATGRVHMWGWCLGGVMAINLYFHSPGLVESLVLSAPSIFPQRHLVERAAQMGAHPADETVEGVLPLAIQEGDFTKGPALEEFILRDDKRRKTTTVCFYRIQKKLCQYAWFKVQAKKLEAPVFLILAARDVVVDNAWTEKIFSPLKNCRIKVIDSEHGIQFERGAELAESVSSWLSLQDDGVAL